MKEKRSAAGGKDFRQVFLQKEKQVWVIKVSKGWRI